MVDSTVVGETKDYKFDFKSASNSNGGTDLLESAETITTLTSVVSDTAALTVNSSSITDSATTVTFWVTGVTGGQTAEVTCKVTTSLNRNYVRSMFISVEERKNT